MEEYSQLNWKDHSAVLLSKLYYMFETNAFVDLTLVPGEGQSIQVHRVILCAASQYFQDLLSQHPADTHTTIILSDVSFEHLRALVEFIYKGTVSVPRSQLPDLLESATYMEIKGLADAIKCSQQQHDSSAETDQPESEETLLKIVSVKSIAQMPSRSDEPMSWENDDVVVKEELAGKLEVVLEFTALGDNTPPAPILFKRDPSIAEEEKEQEEISHRDDDMQSEDLVATDFDDEADSYEEEKSTDSTDEDYATASTSNKLKTKANSTAEKQKSQPKPPSRVPNGTFSCDVCMRSYKKKTNLDQHLKYGCGKEPTFSCTLCKVRTVWKSDLKKHLVRVHKISDSQFASHGVGPKIYPETPFKCHTCQRSYKHKGDLNRHLKECGLHPRFRCTQCDYRAKRKAHLRGHLTSVHSISPADFAAHGIGCAFQCNICLFSCDRNVALQKHMASKHSEK